MALITRGNLFDIDHFVDDFWVLPKTQGGRKGNFFSPNVDIIDEDDHYSITAEIPGIKKENIQVTLEKGVLKLEADAHQKQTEEKQGVVIRQERRYGKFMRSFDLGNNVREGDINASFTDGILTLIIPKITEKTAPHRTIDIQ